MAVSDFYPFRDNQKITAAQLNEIFTEIQNGNFFLDVAEIGYQINSLATRVSAIEVRMDNLEAQISYQRKRQQFTMSLHQTRIELEDVPRLDSEIVAINGAVCSKSGIPTGFVGDYSITGQVITLNPLWAPQIIAGDIVVVSYEFEVS